MGDLDFDCSVSLKVKSDSAMGLPIYGLLLRFHSNIGPNKAPLRDIRFRYFGDFAFEISKSLKVKCDSAIGLRIHSFLLIFNSNIWPNTASWRF